jgi:hypothetical protein
VRIPTQLLTTKATVSEYLGDSGVGGPVYGPERDLRGRFDARRRAVKTNAGVDVVSSGSLLVRPDTTVAVSSKVVIADRSYEVLEVAAPEGLTRPAYRELILGG